MEEKPLETRTATVSGSAPIRFDWAKKVELQRGERAWEALSGALSSHEAGGEAGVSPLKIDFHLQEREALTLVRDSFPYLLMTHSLSVLPFRTETPRALSALDPSHSHH